MHDLLVQAKEAFEKFGMIPAAIAQRLNSWGVNVPVLERNWAQGRV